ncbi:hypothetical protein MHYP_G00258070 [Metynnis hypsauchen]
MECVIVSQEKRPGAGGAPRAGEPSAAEQAESSGGRERAGDCRGSVTDLLERWTLCSSPGQELYRKACIPPIPTWRCRETCRRT